MKIENIYEIISKISNDVYLVKIEYYIKTKTTCF